MDGIAPSVSDRCETTAVDASNSGPDVLAAGSEVTLTWDAGRDGLRFASTGEPSFACLSRDGAKAWLSQGQPVSFVFGQKRMAWRSECVTDEGVRVASIRPLLRPRAYRLTLPDGARLRARQHYLGRTWDLLSSLRRHATLTLTDYAFQAPPGPERDKDVPRGVINTARPVSALTLVLLVEAAWIDARLLEFPAMDYV